MLELLKKLFTAVPFIALDIITFVSRSWYDFIIAHVTTPFYRYSLVPGAINNSSTGKRTHSNERAQSSINSFVI